MMYLGPAAGAGAVSWEVHRTALGARVEPLSTSRITRGARARLWVALARPAEREFTRGEPRPLAASGMGVWRGGGPLQEVFGESLAREAPPAPQEAPAYRSRVLFAGLGSAARGIPPDPIPFNCILG